MIKVYEVDFDCDYQQLASDDEIVCDLVENYTPGEPWATPNLYVDNPLLDKGDFMDCLSLVLRPTFSPIVRSVMQEFGFLLPVFIEDVGLAHIWHSTNELIGALDTENCIRHEKIASVILEYAFVQKTVQKPALFTMSEIKMGLFVSTDTDKPDTGFYSLYEKEALSGLKFTLRWEGEAG